MVSDYFILFEPESVDSLEFLTTFVILLKRNGPHFCGMMKGDNLQARLVDFSVMVIELIEQLPLENAAKHLGGQLLRSGTSPALNYAEARAAESRQDFAHKMKIV